jgi:hypothetical protein
MPGPRSRTDAQLSMRLADVQTGYALPASPSQRILSRNQRLLHLYCRRLVACVGAGVSLQEDARLSRKGFHIRGALAVRAGLQRVSRGLPQVKRQE